MIRILLAALTLLAFTPPAAAQELQDLLQTHAEEVAKPGRRTVGVVLDDLAASGLPEVEGFLEAWRDKGVWQREEDGLFFIAEELGDDRLALFDIADRTELGEVFEDDFTQVKPNGGVRREIGSALVQFQLSAEDVTRRIAAVDAIARDMDPDQLAPLRASIEEEPNGGLRLRKTRVANMLAASFAEDRDERIAAIRGLASDLSVDARATLNQILSRQEGVGVELPEGANVAAILEPGRDLPEEEAYARLIAAELAPPLISASRIRDTLVLRIADGMVGDVSVESLDTEDARLAVYDALAAAGDVAPRVTEEARADALASHVFYVIYDEPDAEITAAAEDALEGIETRVAVSQAADLGLDALSLASIYFLAAIGLAVTFGVMGVINMAHGEFIMMGAYTGFVVQQFVPDYTLSILLALPLAFAVTFGAGVAMERLVIRWLYHRPLETLLATFGISIALQQLAKNIFGTQARPLTSPAWLDGSWVINDVISISYIRIAIFVLALMFLALILFVLKRTRLGLEVRAVTQNPGMAASMGIDPNRINMLTFGLGSGIAGIAGVAIGLYAQVTSEMGQAYIVQSFMTVVVGGVGNVWGTLAGAGLIGGFQKGIEWLNPSNTLAAQTYMILIVILFIQVRPRGIVALKGRAAGD
ncbi:urea ABC transporter permease subunit UrtB [Pontivivens ytuae]|uniref:Urea ABC transporter permease subunit UrtB n=1 Tax=Pontivivens ytuae TaxID=2789856 RepID=A0A7S9QCW4_9RHOB|nr:urea ABC transporter permease subunit UrtB [Pontivivens ytuae]QPH54648.1 urea ABC transporter permease subunit UrtB [Pontivivens ytuae]